MKKKRRRVDGASPHTRFEDRSSGEEMLLYANLSRPFVTDDWNKQQGMTL